MSGDRTVQSAGAERRGRAQGQSAGADATAGHEETAARVAPAQPHDAAGPGRKGSAALFRRLRDTWEPAGMSIDDILRSRHDRHRV